MNECIKQQILQTRQVISITLSEVNEQIRFAQDNLKLQMSLLSNETQIKTNILQIEFLKELLTKASETTRAQAKNHFEKIVTDALQFVTQDTNYRFVIEESISHGKPAYEFYIQSQVNGETTKQIPENACGGGFVDIVSVTLKTAYLEIFSNPQIQNASLFLDEPGKMISEQMSIKFAEYIKFLGKQFNKQVIMVTHNENLANVANERFFVTKNAAGVSKVSKSIIFSGDLLDSVKTTLEETRETDESNQN